MPEALMPILSTIGGSLASKLVGGMFGGGGDSKKEKQQRQVQTPVAKALFQPEQIKQATDQYSQAGNSKWNQILANMGAGGGTGGPEVGTQITTQADAMSKALGGLTDQSGYGQSTDIAGLMKQLEPNIGAKYSVYG